MQKDKDMTRRSIIRIFFGTLLLGASFTVQAGSYWGVGLGRGSWDLEVTPLTPDFSLEHSAAFRLFLGFRENNLGGEMEISYSEHDWKGLPNASHTAVNLVFSGLAYLPLSVNFELYGKLGLNFWTTSVDFFGINYDGGDGIDFMAGVGARYIISGNIGVRLEFQSLPGLDDGIDKGDMTLTTANIEIGF